ncbi:hypothetical protein KY331_00245 [Candidatus Woesearchaeota archaeon]|nr:hypothetical protein [Candidatus Woesearchaeota archaeon]
MANKKEELAELRKILDKKQSEWVNLRREGYAGGRVDVLSREIDELEARAKAAEKEAEAEEEKARAVEEEANAEVKKAKATKAEGKWLHQRVWKGMGQQAKREGGGWKGWVRGVSSYDIAKEPKKSIKSAGEQVGKGGTWLKGWFKKYMPTFTAGAAGLWAGTKATGKQLSKSPDILITFLIIIGFVTHFLRNTTAPEIGYYIDASLAVYVGVIIFLGKKGQNPIKRILTSMITPLVLFFLSQGITYIVVARLPFLATFPVLNVLFAAPIFWPWWAIYGIWTSDTKISSLLKVGHALFIFWMIIWPLIAPVVQPIIGEAQLSRETVEGREVSYPAAYAACMKDMIGGRLSNFDLQTCIKNKMNPPTEEDIRAKTIGRIKKAQREAVKAAITINPNQLFFLQKDQTTMPSEDVDIRGRISATSINDDITIKLSCLVNNKPAEITLKEWTVKKSEIGDSEQFTCNPKEALKRGEEQEVKVTGDFPDLKVNAFVENFFIDEGVLRHEQEKFIERKDPEALRVIEQWSKLKASTAPYSIERATNLLNKEIFKSDIRGYYPDLKVQSQSDPGYVKLNLMTERIYPEAPESSAVIALTEDIDFEIGIMNNLKFGKILKIKKGKFEEWPPFLEVIQPDDNCPIIPTIHTLDVSKINKEPWEKIEYQKEKSFLCKLKYTGGLENPEEIQTYVFSLNMTYDYQIEKKGEFDIKKIA